MRIRDIGMKEVVCVDPETPVSEVAALMKRHNVGAMPVCNFDELLGMITDRDIVVSCIASGHDPQTCPAKEIMTAHPVTARPDMTLEDTSALMGREQIRRLPVIEGGRLVGMVSLADLANASCDNALVADVLRKVSTSTQWVPLCV